MSAASTTASTSPASPVGPVNHEQHLSGGIYAALLEVHKRLAETGFDRKLTHLVLLRASQMNGCAFCVKMHTREARQDGETSDRLDRLIVWSHVGDFSEREKAALAYTEALTELDPRTDFGPLRARLRPHFSEPEISVLTVTIGMINMWNRLSVSNH